jgi:hypothetical protein
VEQLLKTAREAEKTQLGSPWNLSFVKKIKKKQRKNTCPGKRGGQVRREEECQTIFIHIFYFLYLTAILLTYFL